MSRNDYDIAIVGFGPVGAFASLLLAESGLEVAVIERSQEALEQPRAVGLDGESVRAFQRIGLGKAVSEILQPSREPGLVTFTNSRREPYFGLEISQGVSPAGGMSRISISRNSKRCCATRLPAIRESTSSWAARRWRSRRARAGWCFIVGMRRRKAM